jgi:hypothetical protein
MALGQTGDNQRYRYIQPVESDFIFENFSRYKYLDIFSDTILVTKLSKRNKSYEFTRDEFKIWMYKNYRDPKLIFQIAAVVNDGFVIVISQLSKETEIPVRFFTLFISQENRKIVVVEIEENK